MAAAAASRTRCPDIRTYTPPAKFTRATNRKTRMFRITVTAVLVLCLETLVPAQQPTFRGGSDVVRIFATVLDHDGRLVPNLKKEQFEVRDDGKPQPLTLFAATPQPIRLIVMLDVSGSMEGNLPLLRDASDELFARLGPDDGARVGSFGHDVKISETFTHDRKELRAALPQEIAPDAPTPLWRGVDA